MRLREAACWAHLRRDFHDFWASTKSEIAREALDRIGNPKRKNTNNGMLSPVDFENRQPKLKEAGV